MVIGGLTVEKIFIQSFTAVHSGGYSPVTVFRIRYAADRGKVGCSLVFMVRSCVLAKHYLLDPKDRNF